MTQYRRLVPRQGQPRSAYTGRRRRPTDLRPVPPCTEDELTRQLRDVLREAQRRGLLPDWQPA